MENKESSETKTETKTALPQNSNPRIPLGVVLKPPKSQISASQFLSKHKAERIFEDAPVMIRGVEINIRFYILSQTDVIGAYDSAYNKAIQAQCQILKIKPAEVPLDHIFDQKLNTYNAIETILLSAYDPELDKPIFSGSKDIQDFLTPDELNLVYTQYTNSCSVYTPMIDYFTKDDFEQWFAWFKTAKEDEKTFFLNRLDKLAVLPQLLQYLADKVPELPPVSV